jgi:predicted dehydrogenase
VRERQSIQVAVVGVGYFGSFHCGKMADLPGVSLAAVVDIDPIRVREVAERYGVQALTSHRDLEGGVDAAIVAVPTSAHHDVAADLLTAGIDLLVEKPLATTMDDANHLCQLADRNGLRLQVGHLERFNPALGEALGRIEEPRYVRMERSGPFPGRGGDVDVVLELMTHDLDILLQLARAEIESVSAAGWSVLTPHLDVATARIRFADGLIAELLASRISANRCRRFTVLDRLGTLEVDLAHREVRRVVADGAELHTECVTLAPGDPLLEQDRSFVDVLQNGRPPHVGGSAGRAAIELATRILASLRGPRGSDRP